MSDLRQLRGKITAGRLPTMILRQQVHNLVDELPEGQLPDVVEFIHDLLTAADVEGLAPRTVAAIQEGLEDVKAGRTISLDELERKYGL